MYNRYIPQSDGSYRRHSTPEKPSRPSQPSPPPMPEPERECCPPPEPKEPCRDCPHRCKPQSHPEPRTNPGGFLKNLLPGNFDTEDLLIVVLLLLMSGESRENGNLPLLTLALYLFL